MRLPRYQSNIPFIIICSKLLQIIKINQGVKSLCYRLPAHGGRVKGYMICPRRADYNKRMYRYIDFERNIYPEERGIVLSWLNDPNRCAPVILLIFPQGLLTYILKPIKVFSGDQLINMTKTPYHYGDSTSLAYFGSGMVLHNLAGKYIRSAGCSFILVRKDHDQALIKLKSGEMRFFNTSAVASYGVIGNETHFIKDHKTAGAIRRTGRKPRTRPCAMNPVDHPLGGRTRGGKHPCNPKGIITLNRRTVHKNQPSILYTRRHLKFVHH